MSAAIADSFMNDPASGLPLADATVASVCDPSGVAHTLRLAHYFLAGKSLSK